MSNSNSQQTNQQSSGTGTGTEQPPLLTSAGLQTRIDTLGTIDKTITKHGEEIDKVRYTMSTERVEELEKIKNKLNSLKTGLTQRNSYLSNIVNSTPFQKNNLNTHTQTLNRALNTNTFLIPDKKISKITAWISNTRINGIELELSDQTKVLQGSKVTSSIPKTEIVLQSDEFVTRVDVIREIGSSTTGNIGNAVIFHTSLNNQHKIKAKSIDLNNIDIFDDEESAAAARPVSSTPTPTPTPSPTNKEFKIDTTKQNKAMHKARAESQGWNLASIANGSELAKVKQIIGSSSESYAYTGGERIDGGANPTGRDSSVWKWSDGTSWVNLGESMWHRSGQPTGSRGGRALFISALGLIDHADSHPFSAIYSRQSRASSIPAPAPAPAAPVATTEPQEPQYIKQSLNSSTPSTHIIGINNYVNFDVVTGNRYKQDERTMNKMRGLQSSIDNLRTTLNQYVGDSSSEITRNTQMITKINKIISEIDTEIAYITNMNNLASSTAATTAVVSAGSGTTSSPEGFSNFLSKYNISDNYNNMKEGFREGETNMNPNTQSSNSPINDLMTRLFRNTRQSINDELDITDRIEYEEHRNYMLELLSQKDKVLNNVLMDYMINDTEGSNVEQVYETLNQKNTDKLRKIKINNYYSKTYNEYSYLLKVVLGLVLIIFPILLLAKYEIMDRNLTLIIMVVIIFLGSLYILYRLYLLSMKDNKDFDKDRIPYDRQAAELIKQGRLRRKNLGGSLGLTCIGDQCCSPGMSYDATRNVCLNTSVDNEDVVQPFSNIDSAFVSENFSNFFEGMNGSGSKINNENIIETYSPLKEQYTSLKEGNTNGSGSPSEARARQLVTTAITESLNNSTPTRF